MSDIHDDPIPKIQSYMYLVYCFYTKLRFFNLYINMLTHVINKKIIQNLAPWWCHIV